MTDIIWRPQPGPQAALVKCPVFEIFYGGARGGGKTDGMLGRWALRAQTYGADAKAIFFRRELPQLDAAIARSKAIYGPLGAQWQEQRKTWLFPNGATLKFRSLERDGDAEKYQGHDYTDVFFEELTNYPDPKPVMRLKATLRSAAGVPSQFAATGNPGGPGHHWVKARYIDPAPAGWQIITDENGLERVFIPARVWDNKILIEQDPHYTTRLKQSGSEQLVRAWLDGDWDIVEGAFFDCWRHERHVLRPVELPPHWLRFRAFDWGSAAPFSVGWYAVVSEELRVEGRVVPQNALIRYREWYGAKEPNVGLKWEAERVARGIAERERGDAIAYGVADPACFAQDGGPSIMERMVKTYRTNWRPADNKRIPGWDQLRQRLIGEGGRPMLYAFSSCGHFIRTLPGLAHDQNRAEDVDTNGEDHAADECRYACMSRPYKRPTPLPEQDVARAPTFNELRDAHARKRRDLYG